MPRTPVTEAERERMIRLYRAGLVLRQIAEETSRPHKTVYAILARTGELRRPAASYEPTLEDIEAECKKLRPTKRPMPSLTPTLIELLIGVDETQDCYGTRLPDQALEAQGDLEDAKTIPM